MNRIKVDEEIFDHVGKWISSKNAREQSRKGFSSRLNNLCAFA
jgi:hypothetical protein